MAENEIKLNICYGCMRKLEEGQKVCPFCGYDSNSPQNGEDMLPEGTVLFRKYLVGKVLGRGGFGVTYLGYDLDLQLKVAIKEYFPIGVCVRSSQNYNVITASAIEDHTVFSRGCEVFLDEARTLAKFKSPYIVHVRDFFREHGTAYIVMDFEEGVTLKAEMRKNGGKLPYERVLSLMEPLIQQLERLHQRNIIHRDIKPENIMLLDDENGEHLVLLDFGSARTYVSNETKTMTGIVTAGYSPQEQYSQKSQQGPYTDVYALCATMYHAITGVLPPASIERALEGVSLKSFEECGVSVPETVEQAIMHGMTLKSTERTQTMGELLEELKGENVADINENRTGERAAKHSSEAKAFDSKPISRTTQQQEIRPKQTGAVTTRKSERKSSAVPKFLAGVVAGLLLFEGINISYRRYIDDADTKQAATSETASVSVMPTLSPTPTLKPTPTPTPKPTPTPTPTPTPIISKADLPAFKTVGNIVTFGRYEQDNNTSNGKEDIEWIVLANEGNRSLLISRYALDCRQYNTEYKDVTWETCALRSWLNGTFLNIAFTANEQKAILQTSVDNSESQGSSAWSTIGGNNTTDQIFLLSYAEAGKYFSSDSDRICKPTAYTKAQGAYTSDSGNCWWWLRSPGCTQDCAANVLTDGPLGSGCSVISDYGAVRPAFWINLESEIF